MGNGKKVRSTTSLAKEGTHLYLKIQWKRADPIWHTASTLGEEKRKAEHEIHVHP